MLELILKCLIQESQAFINVLKRDHLKLWCNTKEKMFLDSNIAVTTKVTLNFGTIVKISLFSMKNNHNQLWIRLFQHSLFLKQSTLQNKKTKWRRRKWLWKKKVSRKKKINNSLNLEQVSKWILLPFWFKVELRNQNLFWPCFLLICGISYIWV